MSDSYPGLSVDWFDAAYHEGPPWDIGKPQPAMIALLDEFPPAGPVLEVGCGTGDLALALAERGLVVLGVDLAATAIAQAHAKAAATTQDVRRRVEFRVGDALQPSQFPGPFRAVVDAGFFHIFGPEERKAFADDLAATLTVGGRYYLLGFAINALVPHAPREIKADEVHALFAPERGWRILALRPARFVIRSPRGDGVPAIAACVQRTAGRSE